MKKIKLKKIKEKIGKGKTEKHRKFEAHLPKTVKKPIKRTTGEKPHDNYRIGRVVGPRKRRDLIRATPIAFVFLEKLSFYVKLRQK